MTDQTEDLLEGLLAGEKPALARAISRVEDRRAGYRDLLEMVYPESGSARIIGVTGSPGSGKSTLVDGLVDELSESSDNIGVIGIDPSSPFTGGAILGDRIRFQSRDPEDVFYRSMSARGLKGGLAAATGDVIRLLDAAGYDPIIVETVGAGQNEVDIVRTADTVLVVTMPSSGDDVQMLKAGILEIGDVFVVNKADLEGADRTVRDLEEMIHRRLQQNQRTEKEAPTWEPNVIKTVATEGTNVDRVLEAIRAHQEYLVETSRLEQKKLDRCADEINRILGERLDERLAELIEEDGGLESLARTVAQGDTDPYSITRDLLEESGFEASPSRGQGG